MTQVEKCISRLSRRRWENIRDSWVNHIPNFDKPGTAPTDTIVNLTGFEAVALQLASDARAASENAKVIYEETGNYPPPISISKEETLQGLRELVFGESIFLLHKSRHVLGTAEFQIQDGLHTWSLANAYQGAFFAAKATIGFWGISLPEFNGKTIVVDLFPHPVVSADEFSTCSFHFVGAQLSHLPIWEIFQRILAVSTVEIWPKRIVNKLKNY